MAIALFEGLAAAEQAAILESGRVRMMAARDVLAREGESAGFAGLVQVGFLKLTRASADGTDMIVRYLGPGEPFAAIAVLPGARFPVTATAVMPTRMLVWPSEIIQAQANRLPQLKTNLMVAMSGHMSGALERMQELTSERVPQRVARALVRMARDCGERTAEGFRIVHPITRQELADLTGTSLFTVSRLVAGWESQGLVRTARGTMTVVDPDALEQTARATDE